MPGPRGSRGKRGGEAERDGRAPGWSRGGGAGERGTPKLAGSRASQAAAPTCWAEGFRATRVSSGGGPSSLPGPFQAISCKLPPSALHPSKDSMVLKSRTVFKSGTHSSPL